MDHMLKLFHVNIKTCLKPSIRIFIILTCFSWISLASTLEDDRTLMALSSSRIFPSDVESTSKILSSISFNCLEHNKNVKKSISLIQSYFITRTIIINIDSAFYN